MRWTSYSVLSARSRFSAGLKWQSTEKGTPKFQGCWDRHAFGGLWGAVCPLQGAEGLRHADLLSRQSLFGFGAMTPPTRWAGA